MFGQVRFFAGEVEPTQVEMAALFAPNPLVTLRSQCSSHSQGRLDAFASSLGYDNINTLKAAQFSGVARFAAEGAAGQAAWDAEWSAAQEFIAAVQADAVQPTFDNYKAALPASFTAPVYA